MSIDEKFMSTLRENFVDIKMLKYNDTELELRIAVMTVAFIVLTAVAVLCLKKYVMADGLTPAKCAWRISLYLVLMTLSMSCLYYADVNAKCLLHNKHLNVFWCSLKQGKEDQKDILGPLQPSKGDKTKKVAVVHQIELPEPDVKLHKTLWAIWFVIKVVMVLCIISMCLVLVSKSNATESVLQNEVGVLRRIFPHLSVFGKICIGSLFGIIGLDFFVVLAEVLHELENDVVYCKFNHQCCCNCVYYLLVEKVDEKEQTYIDANMQHLVAQCENMSLDVGNPSKWNPLATKHRAIKHTRGINNDVLEKL